MTVPAISSMAARPAMTRALTFPRMTFLHVSPPGEAAETLRAVLKRGEDRLERS
jgi:hypothetical protein